MVNKKDFLFLHYLMAPLKPIEISRKWMTSFFSTCWNQSVPPLASSDKIILSTTALKKKFLFY